MMNVLYLNHHLSGGAAIAAMRLYDFLPKDQVNRTYSFIEGEAPDETYRKIVCSERYSRKFGARFRRTLLRKKVKYYLRRRPGNYEILPIRASISKPIIQSWEAIQIFYTSTNSLGSQREFVHAIQRGRKQEEFWD